jgi:hypothetical protein
MIYLAEITAYNLTTNAVETLRFCTGLGYKDLVNGNYYEPRIEQPALMNREIFNGGKIGGTTTASFGELTLENSDGELDYFTGYAFDGQKLTLRVGEENAPFSSFTTVLIAGISQAALEWARVSIRLRDRIADLQKKKIQPLKFAGTNDPVNNIFFEGGSDLKDVEKPLIFGRVTNVTATLINSGYLIYQISSSAIADVVNVLDKGAYLTRGINYATPEQLRNSTPAGGTFNTCLSQGMIMLGTLPIGAVTITTWENKNVEQNTVAQLVYKIITQHAGINAGELVASDFTTLDAQNAANVGLVCTDGMSVAEALDRLCESVGAFWGFDALNRFRLIRLEPPTNSPVFEIDSTNIIDIERESVSVNGSTDAVYKITVEHSKNYTVQSDDQLAGIVPAERRTFLGQEFRKVTKSNEALKTAHPNAQEITQNTLLCGENYAEPEAQRLLTIFDPSRMILKVTLELDANSLPVLDLNAVVKVTMPRYGLANGKNLRVISIQTDIENNQYELKLWG